MAFQYVFTNDTGETAHDLHVLWQVVPGRCPVAVQYPEGKELTDVKNGQNKDDKKNPKTETIVKGFLLSSGPDRTLGLTFDPEVAGQGVYAWWWTKKNGSRLGPWHDANGFKYDADYPNQKNPKGWAPTKARPPRLVGH